MQFILLIFVAHLCALKLVCGVPIGLFLVPANAPQLV